MKWRTRRRAIYFPSPQMLRRFALNSPAGYAAFSLAPD